MRILLSILLLCAGCALQPVAPAGPRWIAEFDLNARPMSPRLLPVPGIHGEASVQAETLSVIIAPPAPITRLSTNITLEWLPSSSPWTAGYNLYYGVGESFDQRIQLGNVTQAEISLPSGCDYHFAVTSFDEYEAYESEPSNEVSIFPALALQIHLPESGARLESSPDFVSWTACAAEYRNGDWFVIRQQPLPCEFFRPSPNVATNGDWLEAMDTGYNYSLGGIGVP
jgi:hypothetical protein